LISFDTNILVYTVDEKAGERHRLAADLIRDARDVPVSLTEQSIFEFVSVVTRKAKLPLHRAIPYVHELLATFTLMRPQDTVITDVFALIERRNLNIFDARILAVCAAHGCTHLFSEDLRDGARHGGVAVVDPFNAANAAIIGSSLS